MNAIENPHAAPSPAPGAPDDPFRYGWRFVPREDADGRVELEQVPLSLEDIEHPGTMDAAAKLPSQVDDCYYLKLVFETKLARAHEAAVFYNSRIDWSLPGVGPMASDVAVFLGVPRDFDRPSLDLLEGNSRPILVVDMLTPETREGDLEIKKDIYHRAGVPLFVILNVRPWPNGRKGARLMGFRHARHGYEPTPLDPQGKLWLGPLGLWMATSNGRVVCIDGPTGETFGRYGEQIQARAEAEARTMATTKAREAATAARILELEAEVRRLRGHH